MKKKNNLKISPRDYYSMRKAGAFNAQLMDYIRPYIKEGISTKNIDNLVYLYTKDHGHTPATLGYKGFPASCCTSVNDVICHGIPNDYILKDGDIINIDLTTIVDGWHGDSSEMFIIGNISNTAKKLIQCTFDAMWSAIDILKPGDKVMKIGTTISSKVLKTNFSVVKHFQGHGIGRKFHQKPSIPHFPCPTSGIFKLNPGICFTIEPMINEGSNKEVIIGDDGWTARTMDGSLSAQFEHTILMTEDGPEVLTLTKNGPKRGESVI